MFNIKTLNFLILSKWYSPWPYKPEVTSHCYILLGTMTYPLNGERMYPTHNTNLITTTLLQLPTVSYNKWQVTPISATYQKKVSFQLPYKI